MTPQIFSRIFWKQYFLLEKDFVETDKPVSIKFYKKPSSFPKWGQNKCCELIVPVIENKTCDVEKKLKKKEFGWERHESFKRIKK
jgi:hypothetical protein